MKDSILDQNPQVDLDTYMPKAQELFGALQKAQQEKLSATGMAALAAAAEEEGGSRAYAVQSTSLLLDRSVLLVGRGYQD